MTVGPTLTIPMPMLAPLGIPLDSPSAVQDVWATFVQPEQESGNPQSIEMRMLMAILRAVHKGLTDYESAKGE